MDNKKMLIAVGAVLLLTLGWELVVVKFYQPRHPEIDWTGSANHGPVADGTTQPSSRASTGPSAGIPSTFASSTIPSIGGSPALAGGSLHAVGSEIRRLTLGSEAKNDSTFPLGIALTNVGGAIDQVTLNQYRAIDSQALYAFQKPYEGEDQLRSLATRSVTVDGQVVDLANVPWQVASSTQNTVDFAVDIVDGGGRPQVHIDKTYAMQPQGPVKGKDDGTGGYEVTVAYAVQNRGAQPHTVRINFAGPTVPPREIERGADQQIISGYDKGDSNFELVRSGVEVFKPGADTKELAHHEKGYKFLWAGASSNYFNAIIRPDGQGLIDNVQAKAVNPDSPAELRVVAMQFETPDLKIAAGGVANVPLKVYLGPKVRSLLEDDYYSDFPRCYDKTLVSYGGLCAFCASSWLIDKLVLLLRFFHFFTRDWGLAIILLVIVVRLCLHPITKHSQVSMMKMQKLGPELERLKKKYGDDKEAYTKAQMELYKGVGFTPVLGCLPMFLQMPIWIALYAGLQSDIALRQAPFLWGLTWIHDLARPDRLVSFDQHAFTVPLLGMTIRSFNLLPLLLAVVYFMNQKYTPKPPATTPEQAQQQKMMQWMTLLFPVFLYTYPAGLNLYIFTSTSIGILESKVVRDHIKQKQEAEKAGVVIVDAPMVKSNKQARREERESIASLPPAKLGWWGRIQQKVDEVRREAERANKKM